MGLGEKKQRVLRAGERAFHAVENGWQGQARGVGKIQRAFAVGDPQTSAERFFTLLAQADLLDAEGWLRHDVGLVSMGDHFDYKLPPGVTSEASGEEGMKILSWLAAHSTEQVVILAGNHDLSRVMELALFTDEGFQEARQLAGPIEVLRKARGLADPEVAEKVESFLARYPQVPTTELVDRDYSAFSTRQRELVQDLLIQGRMLLAHAQSLGDGRPALFTHAGVTQRESQEAGAGSTANVESDAGQIARALNAFLKRAVGEVKDAWLAGERMALNLEALHFAGVRGEEGGGLLYHRPSNPHRPSRDGQWESRRHRRFHPNELVPDVVQVCGHTGHKKCLKELADWALPEAHTMDATETRTLSVVGEEIQYGPFHHREEPGAAHLHFIDGQLGKQEPGDPRAPLLALKSGKYGKSRLS
jgi:hypothetical protein